MKSRSNRTFLALLLIASLQTLSIFQSSPYAPAWLRSQTRAGYSLFNPTSGAVFNVDGEVNPDGSVDCPPPPTAPIEEPNG